MRTAQAAPNDSSASAALAELRTENGALVVVLGGEWRLARNPPRFDTLAKPDTLSTVSVHSVRFDTTTLGDWDSSLLVFLEQCRRYGEAEQLKLDMCSLSEPINRLLMLSQAVPERTMPVEPPKASRLTRLGLSGLQSWATLQSALFFLGDVALAIVRLVRGNAHMRWREFWVVVQSNSSGALPIVTLIALLVGVIIAFLGVVVLERFGAGYYASYLVGFGMLREMGALMTGIIMAGRTGAGFAAELGSMKISEEIDALVTLGVSPVEHLVMPRLLGIFFMMPLLTLYADFVGIAGGMAVTVSLLDVSATQFVGGMLGAVTMVDALLGIFKGLVYGALIGFAGCWKGLQTGGNASAVGRAATSAVVVGITLIIVANAAIDWLAALLKI